MSLEVLERQPGRTNRATLSRITTPYHRRTTTYLSAPSTQQTVFGKYSQVDYLSINVRLTYYMQEEWTQNFKSWTLCNLRQN